MAFSVSKIRVVRSASKDPQFANRMYASESSKARINRIAKSLADRYGFGERDFLIIKHDLSKRASQYYLYISKDAYTGNFRVLSSYPVPRHMNN